MSTIAERMRDIAHSVEMSSDMPMKYAAQLRADADELERVEQEMRNLNISGSDSREYWADRIRGEVK